MKITFFLVMASILIFSHPLQSQWTWTSGSATINQTGIYGSKGVPSINNSPGARSGATSWINNDGTFWLYGGGGYANSRSYDKLNDLWKYNPSSQEWTWVNGDSSGLAPTAFQIAVYGTKGIPSSANTPGGKRWANSWRDYSGNLWLFGGANDKIITPNLTTQYASNAVWKYDIFTNQWTWISGDSAMTTAGVYGIKGTPSLSNKPGGRERAASWVDPSGNFWVFSGSGVNDLWKYNPSTNEWAWVSGDSIPRQRGVYGNRGVPSQTNKPGGRTGATSWMDLEGNLWLFGGEVVGSGFSTSHYNDLWKFNPTSSEWTWISGDSIAYQRSVFGIMGIPSINNKPGARVESIGWTDVDGNLFLFGGFGFLVGVRSEWYNDMWKFNPSTNEWTWISGDSTVSEPGVYGTKGFSSITNKAGARSRSIGWTDTIGNFWLFGGLGFATSNTFGLLNDLWKYTTNAATTINSVVSSTSLCPGSTFSLPYTASGIYGTNTTFTAQLSNAFGSFENPVSIGENNVSTSGTIEASIPYDIAPGTKYRIRVVSSDPLIFGSDNGFDITIGALPTLTIPDALALPRGVQPNTVYLGYTPASLLSLSGRAVGGTPPYSYNWSNGVIDSSIAVNPSSATEYILNVTDALGCQQSFNKVVKVVDIRCGGKEQKVQICSVVPGNVINSSTTCVSASAVPVLLSLGSYLGNCVPDDGKLRIKVSPNPSHNHFTLLVTTSNEDHRIILKVFNILGRIIETQTVMANQPLQIGASYRSGIYVVEALQGNEKVRTLMVKL